MKVLTFVMVFASGFLTTMAGGKKLVLTEDFRFGGFEHGDERYEWIGGNLPVSFDVDDRGHMFIVDTKNIRILEFDKDGNFVRKVGEQGQGPGEYQFIINFQIFPDGTGVGVDVLGQTLGLKRYAKGLEHEETTLQKEAGGFPLVMTISPTKNRAYAWMMSQGKHVSAITDGNFKVVKTLFEGEWPIMTQATLQDKKLLTEGIAQQFKGLSQAKEKFAGFTRSGRMILADNSDSSLEIWSVDGKKKIKDVNHSFKQRPFEEEERAAFVAMVEDRIFSQGAGLGQIITPQVLKRAIEQADLPLLQPAFHGVFAFGEDGFAVIDGVDYTTGGVSLKLFDKDGRFLGGGPVPGHYVFTLLSYRLKFANGFLYSMERNEDGDTQLVRYTYALE